MSRVARSLLGARAHRRAVTTIRRAREPRRLRLRCAAHGPSRLLRRPVRQHEDDRRARGGRRPLRPGDQRRAVDGAVDDVDGHRALRAPPRLPALGRDARPDDGDALPRVSAHGYDVASFVFDTNYLFKDLPEANVLGTSETLDGAFEWLRANRDTAVLPLLPQLGDAHALRHRPLRPQGLARREGGGHRGASSRDSASALEAMREGYRKAVERQSEVLVASFLEELDDARAPREHGVRVPLRPRRVVGRALPRQGRRQGRLPHARRDALRRDRPGAADPLRARATRAGRRRRRRCARSTSCRRCSSSPACRRARWTASRCSRVDGDRPAMIAGTDMGALTKLAVRMPPWKLILDVESGEEEAYRLDVDPRELGAAAPTRRPSCASSSSASSRAPSAAS